MKEYVICINCDYYDYWPGFVGRRGYVEGMCFCRSKDADPTDFVDGEVDPHILNKNGKCPFYKVKEIREPELEPVKKKGFFSRLWKKQKAVKTKEGGKVTWKKKQKT